MALWYCGSVQHTAVAQWAAGHVYAAGAIVRQLAAPTDANARCFRTTAGGTSDAAEPSWTLTKGGSTTDNTVTWVEVTGNSTYGWNAPFKREAQFNAWSAAGDTLYIASNHDYQSATLITLRYNDTQSAEGRALVVNPAGSVPPVAADITTGGKESTTGNANITVDGCAYVYGHEYLTGSGQSGTAHLDIEGSSGWGDGVFDTCKFTLATTGIASRIRMSGNTDAGPGKVTLLNPTFKFGATGQAIQLDNCVLNVIGGSVDATGSAPTNLFKDNQTTPSIVRFEGVDLSKLGSNTIIGANDNSDIFEFVNCKLGTNYVAFVGTSGSNYGGPEVTLNNCSSGALNYIDEKHNYVGDLTTDASIYRNGGSSDGVTPKSWKIVSGAKATWAHPFECIRRAIRNTTTAVPVTLTVEIENDGTTLTDADVYLNVDYLGSASFPISTRASSKAATILTAGTNLTTSSATWTGTGGQGSPVKQKLSVTFTPQMVGPIYYTICIAKASQTLYVDPKATLS